MLKRKARRAGRGFTLVELMTVMALLTVVSAMAAPVMTEMVARHRIDRLRIELMQSLQSARWEAAARGSLVTMSRVTSCGTALTGSTDWSCGWVVFVDLDGDRIEEPGETRLQVVTVPTGVRLIKTTAPTDSQQFNTYGQSVNLGQRFDLTPTDPQLASLGGAVCFSTGSRVRFKPGTGAC